MKPTHRFALISTTLSILCVGASANAAQRFTPEFEKKLVSVCRSAVDNDTSGLHRAVKKISWSKFAHGSTYRALADGLVCNGLPVMTFAQKYGATETFEQFAKYNPVEAKTFIEIKDIAASNEELTEIEAAYSLSY